MPGALRFPLVLDVHSLSILGARRRGWLGRRRLICMEPQRDSQEKSELIMKAGSGHRALNCIRRLLVFIECIRCRGRSRKLWAGDLPACHHSRCLRLEAGSQGSFLRLGTLYSPPPNSCLSTSISSCKTFPGLCDLGRVTSFSGLVSVIRS